MKEADSPLAAEWWQAWGRSCHPPHSKGSGGRNQPGMCEHVRVCLFIYIYNFFFLTKKGVSVAAMPRGKEQTAI